MEAQIAKSKTCVVCGTDVSQKKRVKDVFGRYYCSACSQTAEAAQIASRGPIPEPDRRIATPTLTNPPEAPVAVQQSALKSPPMVITPKPRRINKGLLALMIVGVVAVIGSIVAFKVVSDRNAAPQTRHLVEEARDDEQAKAELAQAEKLRVEQAKRDLEAKQADERAKQEAAQSDPAKSFEPFCNAFMQQVVNQITATSYICKVDDKFSISLNRTNSLLSPVQGVIEGGVLTRWHGKPNDASTPIRLTFGFKNGTWVLAALESKSVEVFDGPYGREIHSTPWQLSIDLNGFDGFFKVATDRANAAIKK